MNTSKLHKMFEIIPSYRVWQIILNPLQMKGKGI